MRTALVFKKCLRQQLRDKTALALSLFTVPLFVVFYWLFFSGQAISYKLMVYNADRPVSHGSRTLNCGQEIIDSLKSFTIKTGTTSFDLENTNDFSRFNHALINGKAVAGLIIPNGFSTSMASKESLPAVLTLKGDGSRPAYYVVKALVKQVLQEYNINQKQSSAVEIKELLIGLSSDRSPFEAYVPGLLVFSVIMLIFSSSMAVSREIESETIDRLKMTPLTTFDLLAGISAVQVLQGLFSVMLTLMVASTLGFRSAGSLTFAFFISGIACLASIGIGMIVASISKTQNRAFLISSAAMFLLILFSGIIFPRPDIELFYIGNYPVNCFDFLPTTHMAKGLEKILTLGVSPLDLVYETCILIFLSIFYFGAGMFCFNRTGFAATK